MTRVNDLPQTISDEDFEVLCSREPRSITEQFNHLSTKKKVKRHRTPAEKSGYHVGKVLVTGMSRKLATERGKITSLGTRRTYEDTISTMFRAIDNGEISKPKQINFEFASNYLVWRSNQVVQKTLDVDRLALSKVFHLDLPFLVSAVKSNLTSRAYTEEQMELIAEGARPEIALSIRLCFFSGLRAHELMTILPVEEQAASPRRDWWGEQFDGMPSGEIYTVVGKGGLIRPVMLPSYLACELELFRFPNSKSVKDRKIFYRAHYDLVGGQNLSQKFSVRSKEMLGWSAGVHGLRHSYAQNRMRSLMALGYPFSICLAIVSRELGHYRPDITRTYLR